MTKIVRPTTGKRVTYGSLNMGSFFTHEAKLFIKVNYDQALPIDGPNVFAKNFLIEEWVYVEKVELHIQ